MARFDVHTASIAQSESVSGDFAVAGADLMALWCPTITSAAIYLRGSFDTTSANFVRLTNPAGSGDWTFAAGVGSVGITLQDPAFPWPYLRVETAVAQAAARTVALVLKFRTGAA